MITVITLPTSFGGKYIICNRAFDNETLIEEETILGGVKEIGSGAFKTNLQRCLN